MLKWVYLVFCLPFSVYSQHFSISGIVQDVEAVPVSFVTVILSQIPNEETVQGSFVSGTTTDELGNFILTGIEKGAYQLTFDYLGFETVIQKIEVSETTTLPTITLMESAETLEETVVVATKPTITKTPGKLTFTVENTSIATGNVLDILRKTPGVVVSQQDITIKNSTPVIYINEKRVYLSASETQSLLQNMDGAFIQSIEVITNPSAKYDAEAGTVLNIVSSKAVAIGYKGAVTNRYEQAVFAKHSFGTQHFYKNDKVNVYAAYSFSPRKELKEDRNTLRFFEADEVTEASSRVSDFEKVTNSYAHQGNLVVDYKVSPRYDIGLQTNVFVSPNLNYNINALSSNFNAIKQLDSTYTTSSRYDQNISNLSFNLDNTWRINDKGAVAVLNANYILYDTDRQQGVDTRFFFPDGTLIRENDFFTQGNQDTDIFTTALDFTLPVGKGTLETGAKFSTIETQSDLDFDSLTNPGSGLEAALTDEFIYDEQIFAGYINYARDWEKWSLQAGLRAEQTEVVGDSRSLGLINTQDYFEWFPSVSTTYTLSEKHSLGASYARSIERPRYESLNPFRYFINENNFADGNPNLVPAFDDKFTVSYTYDNTWFVEAYYWNTTNPLEVLAFQDNSTLILQSIDANLIREYQYSLDVVYAKPLFNWWYFQMVTSSFYMENEFFALQSSQETATLDTFGFYAQMYSGFTLSKKLGLTSDVTAVYLSDFLSGSYLLENQFNLSVGFKKDLWEKRASFTMGVDDIFNTNNIPLNSRYLNQDNAYFARIESRLFRLGFTYNFGNARLRDNNRSKSTQEKERLN